MAAIEAVVICTSPNHPLDCVKRGCSRNVVVGLRAECDACQGCDEPLIVCGGVNRAPGCTESETAWAQREALMRVVCAGPDLLDALRVAEGVMPDDSEADRAALRFVRAAIAKAEGR